MRGGEHAVSDFVLVGPFRCCRGRASATRKARSRGRPSGRATRGCRSASRAGPSATHGRAPAGSCPTYCGAAGGPTAGRRPARGAAARRCAGSARTSTTRCGTGPSSGAAGHHPARGSASRPFGASLGTTECSAPAVRATSRAADRAAPDGEPQRRGATWLAGSERAATARDIAPAAATRRSRSSRPHPSAGHCLARAAQPVTSPRAGYVAR